MLTTMDNLNTSTVNVDMQQPARANQKKLLIVEDDDFLRELYEKQAVKLGFIVTAAADGEIALEKIKTEVFDMALVDLMLPKIDGVSVIKGIKADIKNKDTKCVVITNLEDAATEKDAMAAGAISYLVKIRYTPVQVINHLISLV